MLVYFQHYIIKSIINDFKEKNHCIYINLLYDL